MFIKHPLIRIFLSVGLVAGIILIIPLKIPFSITTHGKIYHGKEWVVSKDAGGRINAVLHDRLNGRTEQYRLHQFERQDAVRFELNNSVVPGNYIQTGDTVGIISSAQLNREIVSLFGELAVTRASLELYFSGEKDAIVEEAKNRLAYAKQQVAGHSVLLERTKELHQRNLISDEELDIALQQSRLFEIDIRIAEAQLQSALTGAKDEQIAYFKTRISTLEDEIRSLEKTIDEYTYRSPINGIVYHTFSQDTLALIGDQSAYVAVIPVPFHYRPYVVRGQEVKLRVPGNNISTRYAKVHSIGNTVRVMNGDQYFLINAIIETTPDIGTYQAGMRGETVTVFDADEEYLPGILATATIRTDPVTLREYFLRYMRPILN